MNYLSDNGRTSKDSSRGATGGKRSGARILVSLLLVLFGVLLASLGLSILVAHLPPHPAHIGLYMGKVLDDPRYPAGAYVVVRYGDELDVVDGPYELFECEAMAAVYSRQDNARHWFGCIEKGVLQRSHEVSP